MTTLSWVCPKYAIRKEKGESLLAEVAAKIPNVTFKFGGSPVGSGYYFYFHGDMERDVYGVDRGYVRAMDSVKAEMHKLGFQTGQQKCDGPVFVYASSFNKL